MKRTRPHRLLPCGLLVASTLASASAAAQEADDDAEIEVPRTPASTPPAPLLPPSPAPAPAPQPSAAAPAPAPASEPKVEAKGSLSEIAGLPQSTAPAGTKDAPPSLVAEGSNYVRPIRRGLKWWGFIQAQYEQNQLSEDQLGQDGQPLNLDQFVLRRARLRFDRGWDNAAATLELDTSTVNGLRVAPRRAEGSIFYRGTDDDQVTPLLVLTGGITDLPFGMELGESQRDRIFMERSLGSTALFPSEADIGVKLWGAYRFVNYAVAVVNGQPINNDAFPRDPNTAKDIVGRIGARAQPLDTLTVEGGLSFYHGRGFSPGRNATKDSVIWLDDNNNGVAEPHEIQGTTGSAAIRSQNFDRWAFGLDLGASKRTPLGISRLYGELTVAANMDRGLLVSDPIAAGSDVRQLSLAFAAVQQITDYGFVGFRGAFYDPNSDVLEQRAGIFHIKDQSFWVLSPSLGLTLSHARLVAQYDFVQDHIGRDDRGVPTDAKNDQLTVRLQVDL